MRGLRLAVLVVLALALLHLTAVNAFLGFGGLSLLLKSTNTLDIDFRRAWSWYPGVVHVRDLRVVFQDPNLQWSLDMARVKVELSLIELASQTFRATRVQGDGTIFRLRHRFDPASASEPWVTALPPIVEFPDPPVFEATAPEPPVSDEDYNLWTIHLSGVDVEVRELWAQHVRYQGRGRASGAFRVRAARSVWVGPALLELEPGPLSVGGEELAQSLSGTVRCTVHPFDVRQPAGREVLRHISTRVDLLAQGLRAERAWLGELRASPSAGIDLGLRPLPGTLELQAEVDRGNLTESSRVAFRTEALRLEGAPFDALLQGVVLSAEGQPGGRARVVLEVARAAPEPTSAEPLPPYARAIEMWMTSSSRDVTAPWALLDSGIKIGQLHADDLAWFDQFTAASGLRLRAGTLEGSAAATYAQGELGARLGADLEGLALTAANAEATLAGKLELRAERLRANERTGSFGAQLSGANIRIRSKDMQLGARGLDLAATLDTDDTRVHGSLQATSAKVHVGGSGVSLDSSARLDWKLRAPDRSVFAGTSGGTLVLERLLVQSSSEPEGVADRSMMARAPRVKVETKLAREASGRVDASVVVDASALTGQANGTWFRVQPRLALDAIDFDLTRTAGRLRADLDLREFTSDDRGAGLECPFSSLPRARVAADLSLRTAQDATGNVKITLHRPLAFWGDFRASGEHSETVLQLQRLDLRTARGKVEVTANVRDLRLQSGVQATSGWAANIPSFALDGSLHSQQQLSGALGVSVERATGRIGSTTVETDFNANLLVSALDVGTREGHFSGDVKLDNTSVRAGDRTVDDWWARILIDSAHATARQNLDLSLLFHADLRDGLPGLEVLAAHDDLPEWLVELVPLRALEARGTVNRTCRMTDILFTHAQGGPLLAQGRLQSLPNEARGDFLVRLSDLEFVSTGISFDAADTHLSWFAGGDWLDERLQHLGTLSQRISQAPCVPAPRQCEAPAPSEPAP